MSENENLAYFKHKKTGKYLYISKDVFTRNALKLGRLKAPFYIRNNNDQYNIISYERINYCMNNDLKIFNSGYVSTNKTNTDRFVKIFKNLFERRIYERT